MEILAAFSPNWVSLSAHPAIRWKHLRRGAAALMSPYHTSTSTAASRPRTGARTGQEGQIINICWAAAPQTPHFFFFFPNIFLVSFSHSCLFPPNSLLGDVAQPSVGLLSTPPRCLFCRMCCNRLKNRQICPRSAVKSACASLEHDSRETEQRCSL